MPNPPSTNTPAPTDHRGQRRKLAGIVLGPTVVIALMVLAFAAPAVNSGAKDLPLAVGGPEPAIARLTSALETGNPGTF